MDWKIFFATFGGIFFAELADKTQLVGITMASKSGQPFSVWLGSVSAYLVVTAISVGIGATLGKFLRPEWVRLSGGIIFIGFGILMFLGKV